MKKVSLKLKEIDLTKGKEHNHPDINCKDTYLCKINGNFFAGNFSKQWYGLNFDNWYGDSGLQYDTPGTNASMWEQVWLITKVNKRLKR